MWAARSDTGRVVRYSRSSGAICFELPLWGPSGLSPSAFADKLVMNELNWLWTSKTQPHSPEERNNVSVRPLTHLSDSTKAVLTGDLSERDIDGFGRFVALFGLRNLPKNLESSWLDDELKKLSLEDDGVLEIVVLQIGDTPNEYVYVRQNPSAQVVRMFDHWGINNASSVRERKYKALRLGTLENSFGIE